MTQIVIDRERAIVLCEAYTRWRDSCVSALREPMIQKAMRHTWWQKLIGKQPHTRDEAIAHLRRGSLFDSYNILDIWDWGTDAHVRPLHGALKDQAIKTVKVDAFVYEKMLRLEGSSDD